MKRWVLSCSPIGDVSCSQAAVARFIPPVWIYSVMNDFLSSDQVRGFLNVGAWDLSAKIGATFAIGCTSAAAIAVPNKRQKEEAAANLFDKPWALLTPQEQRVAEFSAGHKRWNDFFQTKVGPELLHRNRAYWQL